MKLPRLPRKCDMIDAKYSPEQMREYGEACIKEYIKQIPTLVQVAPPENDGFLVSLMNKRIFKSE